MLPLISEIEHQQSLTYREKLLAATEPGLIALGKLSTQQSFNGTPSVRTIDVFQKASANITLPLNRKTTENNVVSVRLGLLEPNQGFIPVAGLAAYVTRSRRDPPDVSHLVHRDGRERWVIQEGHTRLGAAVLRGETEREARVWEFVESEREGWEPVPRGLHKRGLNYRDKLKSIQVLDRQGNPIGERIDFSNPVGYNQHGGPGDWAHHGTTSGAAKAIREGGFTTDAGKNGQLLGRGVYLTGKRHQAAVYGDEVLDINISGLAVKDFPTERAYKQFLAKKEPVDWEPETMSRMMQDAGFDAVRINRDIIVVFDPAKLTVAPTREDLSYRERLSLLLSNPVGINQHGGPEDWGKAQKAAQDYVRELTGEDPQSVSFDNFTTADGWNYTRAAEHVVVKHAAGEIAANSDGKVSAGDARAWVNGWVGGRPQSAATWATLQNSIQKEFELKDAPTKHLGKMPKSAESARAFVRAQYEATQETLRKQGVDEVVVYRGQPKIDGSDVSLQPGSSWTLSRSLAGNIASYSHGENGRILMAKVPASRVLAMPTTGGALQQAEVVLLGGKLTVEQFNAR
jgi:hypothetical protein